MGKDIRVDAELIRDLARALRSASENLDPEADRHGREDVVQAMTGRHRNIDTLAGSQTGRANFGDFHEGRSLREVYGWAQDKAVDSSLASAAAVRRYARDLEDCLGDLEDTDELSREHFRALGRLALDVDRG